MGRSEKSKCAPRDLSACWRRYALIYNPAKDQRRIRSTEAERVGQSHVDAAPFGVMRHEIDCGFDGGIVEIDGRRGDAVAHGEDREDCLDGACGAQEMPNR